MSHRMSHYLFLLPIPVACTKITYIYSLLYFIDRSNTRVRSTPRPEMVGSLCWFDYWFRGIGYLVLVGLGVHLSIELRNRMWVAKLNTSTKPNVRATVNVGTPGDWQNTRGLSLASFKVCQQSLWNDSIEWDFTATIHNWALLTLYTCSIEDDVMRP